MPYRSKSCLVVAVLMIVAGSFLLIKPALAFSIYRQGNSVFVSNSGEYQSYWYTLYNLKTNEILWEFQIVDGAYPGNPAELTPDIFMNNIEYGIIQADTVGCVSYTFEECKYNWINLWGGLRGAKTFYYPFGIAFFQNNFLSSILAYAGRLFNDLNPMILMWIGIAVGFWIIQYLIDLIVTRSRKNK